MIRSISFERRETPFDVEPAEGLRNTERPSIIRSKSFLRSSNCFLERESVHQAVPPDEDIDARICSLEQRLARIQALSEQAANASDFKTLTYEVGALDRSVQRVAWAVQGLGGQLADYTARTETALTNLTQRIERLENASQEQKELLQALFNLTGELIAKHQLDAPKIGKAFEELMRNPPSFEELKNRIHTVRQMAKYLEIARLENKLEVLDTVDFICVLLGLGAGSILPFKPSFLNALSEYSNPARAAIMFTGAGLGAGIGKVCGYGIGKALGRDGIQRQLDYERTHDLGKVN